MEKEKNILEELKGYLSLNIEISKQNAEDIYLSTKNSGCANVYLGKMIAFTEALSKLKSLTEEEEKNNMETDEYAMTDIIFDPEDKRLIHLKGKLVYAGNTPMEVLKEANGKAVSSYSVGAIGAIRKGRVYKLVSMDRSSNYPFIVKEAKVLNKYAYIPERHFPCIIICK